MTNIKFSKQELKEALIYYSEEQARLGARLNYVSGMLEKLGGAENVKVVKVDTVKKTKVTAKGLQPKKRGPKSIWGDFIIKRLRARNKPLSYIDLIDDAMAIHKLPANRVEAARASILNSAFRLRTVHGKIETVGRAGRKEKLIVLTKWLQEDGSLLPVYAKAFKKLQGGKAVNVDMSSVPVSPYQDEETES